jgi:tRNA 2-thiouridine synthesizing protein A
LPEEIKVDLDLDLRDLLCPIPKDTVIRNISKIAVGGVIKATTTDPHSLDCIPAWMKVMSNEVMKIDRNSGEFVFYIKRLK